MDRDRILRVMKTTLKLENTPFIDDTQETIQQWDSLSHFHLVMNLEKEFGIKFPMNIIPDLTSIKNIEVELEKLNVQ